MIMAQLEADGDSLGEGAEALAHRLPDRLQGFEAVGSAAGVDADALGRAVIDGDEHRGLALAGHHRGQVGPPHQVDPLGGDRAVVGLRAPWPTGTLRRQQVVRLHQPQDTTPAGADAGKAQPGPQLAVALTMKGAVPEQLLDRRHQAFVRHRALRPGPPADSLLRAMTVPVNGGP
jgi:hypothetical protein